MRKGWSLTGSSKSQCRDFCKGPRILQETGSASFKPDMTYMGFIMRLKRIRDEVMHHIQSLQGVEQEWPLLKAPMTPVLSPCTRTCMSRVLLDVTQSMASSSTMASAQTMSLPSAFQLGASLHAAHDSAMTSLMPQSIKASTQMSRSRSQCGHSRQEPDGFNRTACHQARSCSMEDGTCRVE